MLFACAMCSASEQPPSATASSTGSGTLQVTRQVGGQVSSVGGGPWTEKVNLEFQDTPVFEAIERLLAGTGYTVPAGFSTLPSSPRVTLRLRNVERWNGLKAVGDAARLNFIVHEPTHTVNPFLVTTATVTGVGTSASSAPGFMQSPSGQPWDIQMALLKSRLSTRCEPFPGDDKLLDLEVKDASVQETMAQLSQASGTPIHVHPSVSKDIKVTARIYRMRLRDLFCLIVGQANLLNAIEHREGKTEIYILPKSELTITGPGMPSTSSSITRWPGAPVTTMSAGAPVSPLPEVNPQAVLWQTAEPPPNPQAGDVWVDPQTTMQMVYVAAGEFTLGTSNAELDAWIRSFPGYDVSVFAGEQPQCRVRLGAYWIGRTEVTNAQYQAFVKATGHRPPDYWQGGNPSPALMNYPVVGVKWEDAWAYCEWAGGRLPTELEWEKAARGTDGRVYPWGNRWNCRRCRCFEALVGRPYFTMVEHKKAYGAWSKRHDVLLEGPAPVGSHPGDVSPYGCFDMTGNVQEWCGDWHDIRAYERYARGDLSPTANGTQRSVRGGSWLLSDPGQFRCAMRYKGLPFGRGTFVGFRCVREAR
jgi:iron(II)-dependent oxidoreductase